MDRAARTILAALLLIGLFTAGPLAQETPDLPDLGETEIKLDWQDFKKLVEATYVPKPEPPTPPEEVFLKASEYEGRLEKGVLILNGTLQVEVLKEGWVRLPLWSQGAVVSFRGEGAHLNRRGSQLEVIARGPASLTIFARIAFPAPQNPGENNLHLNLPNAPRNLINLTSASEFSSLEVTAGLAYGRSDNRIFVSLPDGNLSMKYTLPFERTVEDLGEEVELEPRIHVAAYQFLELGEGVMGGILVHDYQVRVSKVDHFDIDIPNGIEVFDCSAPGLADWKIRQRDGRRFLSVLLGAPVDGTVRVVTTFEGTYDAEAGTVAVPRFEPLNVERESGFVAVAAEGAEVELLLSGNLLPADVSEIPSDVRGYGGNLVEALKYSGVPDSASVHVTEHEDAEVLTAIIERLNATSVLLDNGVEATWIDLSVKNNRKQFLKIAVAKEVEIWSLLLDGDPARPKRSEGEILIPLPRGDSERSSKISLVLLVKGDSFPLAGRVNPSLPRFDVPVSEAMWTLYLPEDRLYQASEENFKVTVQTARAAFGRQDTGGMYFADKLPMSAPSMAPQEEVPYVSKETLGYQQKQEMEVRQKVKARKGASRKGSLPVRISLPGGVNQLPKITVARILMVGDDDTDLAIWVFPVWFNILLKVVKVLFICLAGILLGLFAGGRRFRGARVWTALAVILALAPFGGIRFWAAFFLVLFIFLSVWLALFAVKMYRKWREKKGEKKEVTSDK